MQVTTKPGEVVKPDSWKVIDEEGMPIEGAPYQKGNLYIQFDVKFPDSLTPAQVGQLQQVRIAQTHPDFTTDTPHLDIHQQTSHMALEDRTVHSCITVMASSAPEGAPLQRPICLPHCLVTSLPSFTDVASLFPADPAEKALGERGADAG